MKPLTLDEMTAPDEFLDHRQDHFEQHVRYLDRCRRVRVGPAVTVVFENRQTLWFRAQELVRVARLTDRCRPSCRGTTDCSPGGTNSRPRCGSAKPADDRGGRSTR
jgi:hypothetical protein